MSIGSYARSQVELITRNDYIDPALYKEYGVKTGLRNPNGQGVLAGLTNISQVVGSTIVDGVKKPCAGELWYRGDEITKLVEILGDYKAG